MCRLKGDGSVATGVSLIRDLSFRAGEAGPKAALSERMLQAARVKESSG